MPMESSEFNITGKGADDLTQNLKEQFKQLDAKEKDFVSFVLGRPQMLALLLASFPAVAEGGAHLAPSKPEINTESEIENQKSETMTEPCFDFVLESAKECWSGTEEELKIKLLEILNESEWKNFVFYFNKNLNQKEALKKFMPILLKESEVMNFSDFISVFNLFLKHSSGFENTLVTEHELLPFYKDLLTVNGEYKKGTKNFFDGMNFLDKDSVNPAIFSGIKRYMELGFNPPDISLMKVINRGAFLIDDELFEQIKNLKTAGVLDENFFSEMCIYAYAYNVDFNSLKNAEILETFLKDVNYQRPLTFKKAFAFLEIISSDQRDEYVKLIKKIADKSKSASGYEFVFEKFHFGESGGGFFEYLEELNKKQKKVLNFLNKMAEKLDQYTLIKEHPDYALLEMQIAEYIMEDGDEGLTEYLLSGDFIGDFYEFNHFLPENTQVMFKNILLFFRNRVVYRSVNFANLERDGFRGYLTDQNVPVFKDYGISREDLPDFSKMSLQEFGLVLWEVKNTMRLSGIEDTKENFMKTYVALQYLKDNNELMSMELFAGRNVLMMANTEIVDEETAKVFPGLTGRHRFAPIPLRDAIKKQNPDTLALFRPEEDTDEAVQETWLNFGEKIRTTPKATIIFENHGSKRSQVFSNESFITYKSKDLAFDLISRQVDQGIRDTVIIINFACLSDDYINDVFRLLAEHNEKNKDEGDQQVSEIIFINNSIPNQLSYTSFKEAEEYMSHLAYSELIDTTGENITRLSDVYALGESLKHAEIKDLPRFIRLGNMNIYYFSNKKIKAFLELLKKDVMQAIYQLTQTNDPETIHLWDAEKLMTEGEGAEKTG